MPGGSRKSRGEFTDTDSMNPNQVWLGLGGVAGAFRKKNQGPPQDVILVHTKLIRRRLQDEKEAKE